MGSQTVQQRWLAAIRDGKDGLKAGPVAVLYVLATFMDADGRNCRPGVARVAEGARCARTTAFEHLRKAAAAGWVEVRQRRGASVYVPCIDGLPLVDNPVSNRPAFPDGEPPVDDSNRPGTPNSENRPGKQDGEAPTVRDYEPNRPGIPNGTSFDQAVVQLASRTGPDSDKADQALAEVGLAPSDRPSFERFLREMRKASSPGGLIVTLGQRGKLAAAAVEWRTWAKPTDQPARFAGWNTKPPGCGAPGCSNGTVEDPNDDYRPYPCPACQPQRVNGHRP